MQAVENMSIALSQEIAAQIQEAVESGEYASSNDVVQDALLEWMHKRHLQPKSAQDLQQLWQQARQDATPGVPLEEVFSRLERKYKAMAIASKADAHAAEAEI